MTTDATVLPEEDELLEPASSSVKAIVGSTLTFIAMVVLWEVLVGSRNPRLDVALAQRDRGCDDRLRSELFGHFMVTLYESLVGFVLAIIISIPLAVAVVYSPILQNTIYPILLAFQSMPKVAIAPLLALWIGFGTLPNIIYRISGTLLSHRGGHRDRPHRPTLIPDSSICCCPRARRRRSSRSGFRPRCRTFSSV